MDASHGSYLLEGLMVLFSDRVRYTGFIGDSSSQESIFVFMHSLKGLLPCPLRVGRRHGTQVMIENVRGGATPSGKPIDTLQ